MACFIIPAAEAVVTTIVSKATKKNVKHPENIVDKQALTEIKVPFRKKLSWLTTMLWGGSALLCLEHIWHGEVVPFPPFLTAVTDPQAKGEMLHEMSTVGVCMAALITAVWAGMVIVSGIIEKKSSADAADEIREV